MPRSLCRPQKGDWLVTAWDGVGWGIGFQAVEPA